MSSLHQAHMYVLSNCLSAVYTSSRQHINNAYAFSTLTHLSRQKNRCNACFPYVILFTGQAGGPFGRWYGDHPWPQPLFAQALRAHSLDHRRGGDALRRHF